MAVGGKYQKINGNNSNKVKTMLIYSDELHTPYTIFHKNGKIDSWGVVKYYESDGDGTVIRDSAMANGYSLKSLWSYIEGSGKHIELMGNSSNIVVEDISDRVSVLLMEALEDDEPTEVVPTLQITTAGCESGALTIDGEDEEGFDGSFTSTLTDGEYELSVKKSDTAKRMTVSISCIDGENVTEDMISFLCGDGKVAFSITGGELSLKNEKVKHIRSYEEEGCAKLKWDSVDGATGYKVYSKVYSEDKYKLLDEVDVCEYMTEDVWLAEFAEDCIKYYVVPVFEDGDGGYDCSASNYNNSVADFDWVMDGDTVTFTDKSQGEIDKWEWDFDGDGVVDSYEQNPTYQYLDDGIYDVTLTVSGPSGTDVKELASAVKVGNYVEEIVITLYDTELSVGDSTNITVKAIMADGTETNVTEDVNITSSSSEVLTADNGVATAKNAGMSILSASYGKVFTSLTVEVSDAEYEVKVTASGNGYADGDNTYYSGEEALISAIAMDGEEFIGWYQGDNCVSTQSDYKFVVSSDAEYEARFTEKTCGIKLFDGESLMKEIRVIKGEKATLPYDDKDGYQFVGYYKDAEFNEPASEEDVYTADASLYARYFFVNIDKGNYKVCNLDISENTLSAKLFFDESFEEKEAVAYIATYDDYGNLLEIRLDSVTVKSGFDTVSVELDDMDYERCVIMIWDGMVPLLKSVEL